ncbi:MAG: hypothetical protein D6790_11485 [Caldilineae bacterium]|nr:MAG: hypothetical protein D6790_11485 [Caldilineae bacterium]
MNLHAVDYRYADSGGVSDPDYTPALGYGALNGVKNSAWGALPYQSVRVNQTGRSVDYRYDHLRPGVNYQLHLSFYQSGDNNRVQQVEIDGKPVGPEVTLVNGEKQQVSLAVPAETYTDDGSIAVSIVRTNADVGAIVNEIALEEQTIPAQVCDVTTTPYWTQVYGGVTVGGQPAPAGTIVTAENIDGVIVGCFQVATDGFYGFMPIFGGDSSGTPALPGMADGEQVKFRVNGSLAVAQPGLAWSNDKDIHRVDLVVQGSDSQWFTLNPGWNLFSLRVEPPVTSLESVLDSIKTHYCLVQGEEGAYDCNLAAQFQQLKETHGAKAYYIRIEGGSSVNLLVMGTPITPTLAIPLHADWNWVGFLPTASMPVGDALQSIAGSYLRAADGKGRLYDPSLPQFSTLTHMAPGDGYLIFATQPVTLTYPAQVQAAVSGPAATSGVCPDVSPTPLFTWLYGDFQLNGQPAPEGTRVDVLTPRGELAGCFLVDTPGQYGFLPVYGADAGAPPLPGFTDGEPMRLRVNGREIEQADALRWRNDKESHRVDLDVNLPERFYLPFVGAQAGARGEAGPADDRPPVYLPILGR